MVEVSSISVNLKCLFLCPSRWLNNLYIPMSTARISALIFSKPLKCATFSTSTYLSPNQFKHTATFQHNKASLSSMNTAYIWLPCIPRGGSILLLTDDNTEDATCLVCYVRLIESFSVFLSIISLTQ